MARVTWEVKNTSQPIKTFRLYVRKVIGPSLADVYEIPPSSNSYILTGLGEEVEQYHICVGASFSEPWTFGNDTYQFLSNTCVIIKMDVL